MSSPTLTFTPAMFHASLTGLKNTTRRVITADCFRSNDGHIKFLGDANTVKHPPHAPGQIKPMVTGWRVNGSFDNCKPSELDAQQVIETGGIYLENIGSLLQYNGRIHPARFSHESKLYPARFFPKSLYPLAPQVEILTVTPEFLHDITEDGAKREGIYQVRHDANGLDLGYTWSPQENSYDTAREAYFKLWDTINADKDGGKYAAQHNPACWVITYRLLPAL
jgi:hypothetical protein